MGGSSGAAGSAAEGGRVGTGGNPATGGSQAAGGATGTGGVLSAGGSAGGVGNDAGVRRDGSVDTSDAQPAKDAGLDSGSGTGGSGDTFQPCPTTGVCKILPFGDSITFGLLAPDYTTSKEGGYRIELFTRAVDAKQNITFTGSQTSGPTTVDGKPFPQNNEGHSGWTIDPISGSPGGISTLVPSPAFDTVPNIVLLMIGTNDCTKISAQTMFTDLGKLIDNIFTAAPNILLAVAKLPPLASGQSTIDSYNKMIDTLPQVKAGKHLIVVDQSTLTSSDLGDGVHPNEGGYKKMGDNWYEAIKSYLPAGT